MALARLDNFTSPNSVTIFATPPGNKFAAFVLSSLSIPTPNRVRLDLAESENWRRTYTLTRNPVERMTAQSRIKNPDTISIVGMLSAHPLNSPLAVAGLARLDRFMLLQLHQILGNPATVAFIVTPDRKCANMVCTSISETNDDTTGHGTALALDFEEILIATPGLVSSTLDLEAMALGASSTSDMGPTTPVDVPDPGGLG